jgi:hypothetical protein
VSRVFLLVNPFNSSLFDSLCDYGSSISTYIDDMAALMRTSTEVPFPLSICNTPQWCMDVVNAINRGDSHHLWCLLDLIAPCHYPSWSSTIKRSPSSSSSSSSASSMWSVNAACVHEIEWNNQQASLMWDIHFSITDHDDHWVSYVEIPFMLD